MWVWPVLLGCVWACVSACPEGCSCAHDQGVYTANCSSLPFSGGKVQALNLQPTRDNPLELSDGQFNAARHLKYLNLKNSSIYFIHKKAFYGAKNVVEIDLSFNYIEELEPTVFQHLTSLTTLVLRGNPIQFVSEVPFLISNSLQHLDIGQCKIRSVPREVFYGLKRLKYLSMDGNFLKSLKYNSLPKGLKYLNLSRNLIVNVPTEVLSALTNLRRIGLSGNPINCSCSLLNLQDWLSGRGVIFEDDVVCQLPSEYFGISWSKVDENRQCLAEVRRAEMSHSDVFNPLFKNRLYRHNYFENEKSSLGENLQSDQPQTVPDPQAEVLFQNDETFAMGEMMRDEEDKKSESDPVDSNREEATAETDKQSALIAKSSTEEKDAAKIEELQDIDVHEGSRISEDGSTGNKIEETILSVDKASQNGTSEVGDLNLQENDDSLKDSTPENHVKDDELSKQTVESNEEILDSANESTNNETEKVDDLTEDHDLESLGSAISPDLSQPVNLNESNPVEYKTINEEDSNAELDDFKKEGFFHVENDKYKVIANDTSEESTAIPDTEDATEIEVDPTPDTLSMDTDDNDVDEVVDQNSTSSTETNNSTILEETGRAEEDVAAETVPPPVIVQDVHGTQQTADEHTKNESELSVDPQAKVENKLLSEGATDTTDKEEKIKQVAGAEVVMFCIAVLILSLILYSVYKCRNSNKRQNTRINKDMESNRGTEMQDMASLLPKPEDNKKANLKYPDKAPSSETVKLMSEKSENEAPSFTPVSDTKNKVEDKNSLNNNTPSSPTSKTPLIKPGNPVAINLAAPIQRTKVKVGIIPDSIPRTPIFLQKTYNNGTKHV